MRLRKIIGGLHLWLGLASGLVVCFLAITGCLLTFQREIETITVPWQFVAAQKQAYLPPTLLYKIAKEALPNKVAHSVTYGLANKAAVVSFYIEKPRYYYLVYINPYTGNLLKVRNMDYDFFRLLVEGHYNLWLPIKIGKPIVAAATLLFVVMMVTGIVLWWPKNKAARKQRFTIKWTASWKRVNYDLHNVVGFYLSWITIFIAITGLVWGFEWAAKTVYWVASGGKQPVAWYEAVSKSKGKKNGLTAIDGAWGKMFKQYPYAETIEVHFPNNDSTAIEVAINPDKSTYWKTDYRYFDQQSLQEISVNHPYGTFKDAGVADKVARMNYDIHVGAILGMPSKVIVFLASLLAGSLPITGFLIWRGRKKKVLVR